MSTVDPRAAAYLKNAVLTAPPEQLRMMLLDGSLRFARRAKDEFLKRDHEAAFIARGRCREIVIELITSIRDEPDPELAQNVRAVWTYIYTELVSAAADKSVECYDRVIALLQYERDTWALLLDKLAQERAGNEAGGVRREA